MRTREKRWLLVPAMILALPLTALAQFDPFGFDDVVEEEPEPVFDNFVDAGLGYLDVDSFAFGRYSGITEQGLEAILDFGLQMRSAWDGDQTGYWRLEGWRVGLESRRLEMEIGQQGTQRLFVGYRGMPNYRYDDGQTPFVRGTAFLGLPPQWTAGTSTLQMPALGATLRTQTIEHERQRLDVGYQRLLDSRWSFNADYRREMKEGRRMIGGLIGNSGGTRRSALLPAPVDFVTDIVDASVQYQADRYQAGAGVHASVFENERPAITWQNPFGQIAGWAPGAGFPQGLGRTALEPDNRFYQARAFGGYSFSPVTRVSGHVAAGRMRQDDRFLPYTVNPALNVPVGLPRDRLDGRIDTLLADIRLTTQPLPQLNLTATYRFDDRDNRTPQDVYLPVRGDSQHQVAYTSGRINLPYSFSEQRFSLDARYRLAKRTRLVASYTRSEKDRDFMEVRRMDEDIYRIGLQLQPGTIASLGIDYIRADRKGSRYDGNVPYIAGHVPGAIDPLDPLAFENHPQLRKYFLADRTRDQIRARGDIFPWTAVGLGLEARYSRDDYEDGFFGLDESRVQAYTADATWTPTAGVSVSTFFTHERFDAAQTGRSFRGPPNKALDAFNPARDWAVDSDDRIDTAGLNAEWRDLGVNLGGLGRLDVGADVVYSRSRTELGVTSGPALTTAPLPDLYTRLAAYGIYGNYRISAATAVRIRFEHERFRARDFQLDDVPPEGVDAAGRVLGLGVSSPSYTANWMTISMRHQF
jgi:MtrB/PioB family decaheme-associated outer membrane protein